jgi:hypothetical protein
VVARIFSPTVEIHRSACRVLLGSAKHRSSCYQKSWSAHLLARVYTHFVADFVRLSSTRVLTSGGNARENLWIESSAPECALETMLGARLREPLDFEPYVDWSGVLAASLKGQIEFLMHELARPGGVADNPVALASLTDLIVLLTLRGLPHNYSERLTSARCDTERSAGLYPPRRGIYAREYRWTDPHRTSGGPCRVQHPHARGGLSPVP